LFLIQIWMLVNSWVIIILLIKVIKDKQKVAWAGYREGEINKWPLISQDKPQIKFLIILILMI
jgi:hypothetical protein